MQYRCACVTQGQVQLFISWLGLAWNRKGTCCMAGQCHGMMCMNLSPVCEWVSCDCVLDCPVTLSSVYCILIPLCMPLYIPAFLLLIYLFVVYHCMCVVRLSNFPHETLTYPGPGCSKDRQTDNVPVPRNCHLYRCPEG